MTMTLLCVAAGERTCTVSCQSWRTGGSMCSPVHTPATVTRVPNKPKTPVTGFRIPEDVKAAAVERAAAEGKTLTEVVVASLKRYGKGKR